MTQPATAAATAPILDARAAEILDAITEVFAAKGFDGASMQDLARAAGMSAGNFYRYFPSKDAIVTAIVERFMAGIEDDFGTIFRSPDPLAATRAAVRHRIEEGLPCDGVLWAEIEACAQRRPEVAAIAARTRARVQGQLLRVMAVIAGLPEPEAERRFAAHAATVLLMVKSVAMQAQGAAAVPGVVPLVLRAIDAILDDIATTAKE
ncbi:TetR/AcrR family transcriptional regulator [Ruixingdingia sedimenti]|uniref:Helix-turn-helix domain-containing protein n=1 Tax=Ruixingdingia sedimenti TaxID=3073604 RepID=A0ABU1F4V7_9RHOB|nr:helix-turn-helix domain-containing protein [Xinfangfangia sp. LG-4]MDR5651668.1 helix-turn-helix domain-containing protein [Xinfangfangia sp. LG-4]